MKVLHIDSSIKSEGSVSRSLSQAVVDRLAQGGEPLFLTYRDLGKHPLKHFSPGGQHNDVLEQFLDSDVVVLGVPMYNFSVPSSLKSWIDHITVAGKTFRYTEKGPRGLAGDKTVIAVIGSGGRHAGQPTDFVEPYLRTLFGFLGVGRLEIIRAEGVDLSGQDRAQAMEKAMEEIQSIFEITS